MRIIADVWFAEVSKPRQSKPKEESNTLRFSRNVGQAYVAHRKEAYKPERELPRATGGYKMDPIDWPERKRQWAEERSKARQAHKNHLKDLTMADVVDLPMDANVRQILIGNKKTNQKDI